MAAQGESKGKTPPPAEGGGDTPSPKPKPRAKAKGSGGERKPRAAHSKGEPSEHHKMGWVAIMRRVPGSWLYGGVSISLPHVEDTLNRMGDEAEGHNVLIVPFPYELIGALADRWPSAVQPVKGRLADLVLYPLHKGNNQEVWNDYLDAHPARSAHISETDFRHRKLTLPKE